MTQYDCSGVGEYLLWKVSVCPVKGFLKANIIWTHDSCYSSICLNDVENMVNARIGQNPSCTGSLFLTVLWALLSAVMQKELPWNRQQHVSILIVTVV